MTRLGLKWSKREGRKPSKLSRFSGVLATLLLSIAASGQGPRVLAVKIAYASSCAETTACRLDVVGTALADYRKTHGVYPEVTDTEGRSWLYKLIWEDGSPNVPYFAVQDAELSSIKDPSLKTRPKDVQLLDCWGYPIFYAKSGSEFVLFSVGLNGIDESGAGDDILFTFGGSRRVGVSHSMTGPVLLAALTLIGIVIVVCVGIALQKRRAHR